MFKYDLDEASPFMVVNFLRGSEDSLQSTLPLLWPTGHPISTKKYNDIKALLKYVAPVLHPFYLNLKTIQTDIHLFEDELLDESEEEGDTVDEPGQELLDNTRLVFK